MLSRLVWAGNSGTPSVSGHLGAYGASYVSTHLGQLWQGPLNGSGTQEQYLYCSSSQPHQLTGLYGTSATCSTKTGQVYGSSYDAWGNVTSRSITNGTTLLTYALSYDGQDHLVRWNDTVTTTNEEWYMYDGMGQRVLRRSQTGTGTSNTKYTVYAFGVQDDVYDGSGASYSDKYYYSLAGRLLGELNGGKTKFLLTDLLGSVVASISNTVGSAAVLGNQVYGPYGNGSYSKGTITTPKGYTGQYNDALTTLDYYNARYYDPAVGVFLSVDTVLGNGSGENPYAYVGGNPETWSDPSGHSFIPPSGGGSSGNSLVPFTPPSGSSNTNAVQPCLAVGCVAAARVGTPIWVAQQSRTLINVAAIICGGFCFAVPTTVISTNITWHQSTLESSVLVCGLPYPCSDEKQESIGQSGHDMPEGSFAGGGAAGDPAGAAGDVSPTDPQETESKITPLGEGIIQQLVDKGVEVIRNDPEANAHLAYNNASGVTWFNGTPEEAGPQTTTVLLGENATDATVYEEWLHVLEGEKRGWLGLGSEEWLPEEIMIKQELLAKANWLGLSDTEVEGIQQWLKNPS